jgi:xanthine dehydrogenase YagS FAD-binding subunit
MNPFAYASPATLEDAASLLGDRWDQTSILAGGTDLVTSLKQGIIAPERVVSLKDVSGLKGIQLAGGKARIGAMTSLAVISEHEEMRQNFPSLVHAIESIGSPQILARATLGGNLCQRPRCWYYRQGFGLLGQREGKSLIPEGDNRYHAIFGNGGPAYFVSPSTLAPALIALDADIEIAGPNRRSRTVKVAQFYRIPQRADQREYALDPNEIVTAVSLPLSGLANATYKVRQRSGLDWPLVTASVAFQSAASARRAAVVLGHVAPVPWPAPKAAAVLEGKRVDQELAARAGDAATDGATPLSMNQYKVQLVKTAVKRAILVAADLMEG